MKLLAHNFSQDDNGVTITLFKNKTYTTEQIIDIVNYWLNNRTDKIRISYRKGAKN